MFLKSVRDIFLNKFSLKLKLTLFFSIILFTLAAGVAVFSCCTMNNLFTQPAYQFLLSEIDTLKYLINKNNRSALLQEISDIPEVAKVSTYQYYIRLYEIHQKTLFETQGMDRLMPFKKENIMAYWPKSKIYKSQTGFNRDYLVMETCIANNGESWFVQIILDISDQNQLMKKYQKNLLFALMFAAILSILLGHLLMKHSMKRLLDITKAAHNITPQSLHQRIDPSLWPKEFNALGLAFNKMLDRIENSFIRLKDFSADLAHELRTPINNLMGQTEVALLKKQTNAEYEQVLESNLEELKYIADMVESILFLAQAENPQLVIVKKSISVHQEIEKLKNYFQEIAEEKNIRVLIHGACDLSVNPEMFRRMLSNLLLNALKFTSVNGFVNFKIVSTHEFVHIEICDNGEGIPREHLDRLFDRFYRVDKTRSKRSGGSGLGLAIVKSIVELHQGTITIQSQKQRGTRVSLQFPK